MPPLPARNSGFAPSPKPLRVNSVRRNIHVAHLIIDAGVDTEWVRQRRIEALGPNALDNPDLLMPPSSVAEAYWQLYQRHGRWAHQRRADGEGADRPHHG